MINTVSNYSQGVQSGLNQNYTNESIEEIISLLKQIWGWLEWIFLLILILSVIGFVLFIASR